jgi:alpha-ketoglutarate-dependent taurine dioxygenase
MSTETIASPSRTAFDVRPFDAPLGAEVLGLDLAQPLSAADFERLRSAFLDHHLLVFRDQRLTPTQQSGSAGAGGRCSATCCTSSASTATPKC